MNLLGKIASLYVPAAIRKKNLMQLFRLSARAFQCEIPSTTRGKSYLHTLEEFARFTEKAAREVLAGRGNIQKARIRLFRNAFMMGYRIRKLFGIQNRDEVMQISKKLYDILQIDFQGDPAGNVIIHKCYFSKFYSPEICQLISALDEGIAAGLSGGKLTFHQRITEGKPCCLGKLILPET